MMNGTAPAAITTQHRQTVSTTKTSQITRSSQQLLTGRSDSTSCNVQWTQLTNAASSQTVGASHWPAEQRRRQIHYMYRLTITSSAALSVPVIIIIVSSSRPRPADSVS